MGDVGGLLSFLQLAGTFIVWVFTGEQFTQYVISNVFRFESKNENGGMLSRKKIKPNEENCDF